MNQIPQITNLFGRSIQLDAMLDEIPIAIVVLDPDRRIVYMNKAVSALTGYSLAEARGITCHNIIRSGACIQSCPLARLKTNSEPVCVQSDLINRDHQRIPIRMTLAPLSDSDGNVTGFLESIEDIRSLHVPGDDHSHAFQFSEMIGKSPGMTKVFEMLPLIALNDSCMLLAFPKLSSNSRPRRVATRTIIN